MAINVKPNRKLTLLPGASALPPPTIFYSLSALQRWLLCTQLGYRLQQNRGCCIPAQHRRAAMTRTPRAAAAPIKAVLVRAAGGEEEGGGGLLQEILTKVADKCFTIVLPRGDSPCADMHLLFTLKQRTFTVAVFAAAAAVAAAAAAF